MDNLSEIIIINKDNNYRCMNTFNLNIAKFSNMVTFVILLIGLLLVTLINEPHPICNYILAFGLFGFSGGITNHLAIHMIFEKIYIPLFDVYLKGTGIIEGNFDTIRKAIAAAIIDTILSKDFVHEYISDNNSFIDKKNILNNIKKSLPTIGGNAIITHICTDEKLLLMSKFMKGNTENEKIQGLTDQIMEMANVLIDSLIESDQLDIFSSDMANVIHSELTNMVNEKISQMQPEGIKYILENVIKSHLGWLVFWGNMFGGIIGIISTASGY